MRIIRAACLWALIALAWCAFVVALSTKLRAHEGYQKWNRPDKPAGYSCCNDSDCAPIQARLDGARRVYQIFINREWVDVPREKILDPGKPANVNPDGSFHACWNHSTGEIYCFREAEPKI